MNILLRGTKIVDPTSKYNGKQLDLFIEDGIISQIGNDLSDEAADEVIEGDDLHVSQGWVDLFATFGDPGKEFKEDISSGLAAAAAGGFTKVALAPTAQPAIDSKSSVEYVINRAKGNAVDLLPLGAVSKKLQSTELAEMFDMKQAGAIGMSNGKNAISNPKLQHLALLYSKNLGVPVYSFANEDLMAHGGLMHEGDVNIRLGMKGIPALAEEMMVARDLYLAEYAEVGIHFSHITTAGSVDLIRNAKAKGLHVTASVPAHHLLLTDATTEDFDSNFKVLPPFRDAFHINALIEGLKDGTIDAIISDHEPHEFESKFSEFSVAEFGISALETAFSAAFEGTAKKLSLETLVSKLTTGPRKVLNIKAEPIVESSKAELTVFSPSIDWTCESEHLKSRSHNSPVLGRTMKGLPVAIINNGQLVLNA